MTVRAAIILRISLKVHIRPIIAITDGIHLLKRPFFSFSYRANLSNCLVYFQMETFLLGPVGGKPVGN